MTALTRISAERNIDHGDNSRGIGGALVDGLGEESGEVSDTGSIACGDAVVVVDAAGGADRCADGAFSACCADSTEDDAAAPARSAA